LPKLSRHDREQIAQKRIISVLGTQGVVNSRTLEQKIADAGPSHLRIQPHILTGVRASLVKQGQVVSLKAGNASWLHLADENPAKVTARFAELSEIWGAFSAFPVRMRTGQALEIAVYKAMLAAPDVKTFGGFTDLSVAAKTGLYQKDEVHTLDGKSLGKEALDFIVQAGGQDCGVEVKNVREWLYPNRSEIRDAVRKALTLDTVPVIVARRIPYVTYRLLTLCGVILHQNYNQLMATEDEAVATLARRKDLLGYHDLKTGDVPDARLLKFFAVNLPSITEAARERLEAYRDLLTPFAEMEMGYDEFAARVRRRENGGKEDNDWPEDPNEYGED
jgi:hypothetical protein